MPELATKKGFRSGSHRLVEPKQTLERIERLLPIFGITRVANITGLDSIGLPVVMVCRPNSRSLAVSQGKGLRLDLAQVSGIMESVEMYHAERITLPLRLASFNELQYSLPMSDPTLLPMLSVSAYHAEHRMLWIEARDLIRGGTSWLPYELVHMNCTLPFPPGSGCFVMSSNGLASGNHPLEALLHALCEVVERDAYTLWSYRGDAAQAKTRIILDSIDDPLCREVLELYKAADLTVAVWEITSDIGVPAYRCMIVDRDPQPTRLVYSAYGTGCHPAPEIALMRSLTEAAQSRATLISGSRDDVPRGDYELSRNPDAIQRIRTQLAAEPECRRYAAGSGVESDTFEEDVAWCLAKLGESGIENAYVVDLTKEELGIPVMRVIVPGLEGNHTLPGFRAGARARAALETASQQAE